MAQYLLSLGLCVALTGYIGLPALSVLGDIVRANLGLGDKR